MFKTTIAGSLPKPGWLAETNKLSPAWRANSKVPVELLKLLKGKKKKRRK